jgi:hypothetical protein
MIVANREFGTRDWCLRSDLLSRKLVSNGLWYMGHGPASYDLPRNTAQHVASNQHPHVDGKEEDEDGASHQSHSKLVRRSQSWSLPIALPAFCEMTLTIYTLRDPNRDCK